MKLESLQSKVELKSTPAPILPYLRDIAEEDDRYAADEIVAASEQLLKFLSALFILAYIHDPNQNHDFNQFLLELFTKDPHGNAGVLLWRTSKLIHLVEKGKGPWSQKIFKSASAAPLEIKDEIRELSERRNQLMHGIFVAPPEANRENAEKLCDIIEELFSKGEGEIKESGGSLSWNGISADLLFHKVAKDKAKADEDQILLRPSWDVFQQEIDIEKALQGSGEFFELYQRSLKELDGTFLEEEANKAQKIAAQADSGTAEALLEKLKSSKGAVHIGGGLGSGKSAAWAGCYRALQDSDYIPSAYGIQPYGLTFTANVMLELVAREIEARTKKSRGKNKAKRYIEANSSDPAVKGKVVVLLDDIHLRMFSSAHVFSEIEFLYQHEIRLVGFSPDYPWMRKYFNERIELQSSPRAASDEDLENCMREYIRDRGPYPDDSVKDAADYERLKEAIKDLKQRVSQSTDPINLRRLASEIECSLALLEEAAAILSPVIKHGRQPFEKETRHKVLDRAIVRTEESLPYDIMRRRDIRLEWEAPTIARA